ncbi:MAG: acetylglutamate kinase [Alphaproteobacteria bacterium]|nr:acetylglutamate kinase [Alphaproteobacteria bacterium]OJV13835.1 MAG: hypothetical protein BGO27_08050 [Alphaproteobacteria bacterium 33-17]
MRLLKHPSVIANNIHKPKAYNNEFNILSEAIPYIKLYEGQTMVISFDEAMLESHEIMQSFAQDLVLLKNAGINPIIVHGACSNIKIFCDKNNYPIAETDGVINADTQNIDIVEMVALLINKKIVSYINNNDGLAVGVSGKDARLIEAKKVRSSTSKKVNNVEIFASSLNGEVLAIHPDLLSCTDESDLIPVIASIGFNDNHPTLYLNHDSVASMISSSISASKVIYLTEENIFLDDESNVIEEISSVQAKNAITPKQNLRVKNKIKSAIEAVEGFTESAHFLSSSVEHGLIFEVLSDNRPGTVIYPCNV